MIPAGARLLAEARLGLLLREGKTLTPDTRKGMLRVIRTEDGLVHLMWAERTDGGVKAEAERDVIVFPDEAAFSQIPNQRAAALKFAHEPDRNLFFWIQEGEPSADAALLSRLDAAINTPLGGDGGGEGDEEMLEPAGAGAPAADALLRGALATGPGAGMEVPGGPMVGSLPQGPGQDPWVGDGDPAAQLAAMLSGIASGGAGGGAGGGADAGSALGAALLAALARQQHAQRMRGVAAGPSLADVLRPEVVAPLLADPEVLARLGQHLPEEHRSLPELRALARSAQFQQQLAAFSGALQTGQLDLSQFGLRAEGFSVSDFLRALEDLVERERAGEGGAGGGGGR
ncbi:26S proteasome regulatory subunit [Raphidocelis subcapitata]|uniref:26S proteasome regulatory subunit n=1 Tax=Raphidocelis subcapitata TaxID=307507 RepID=A0A2V0P610_9CHLO|nr:26S proteasome regulatory subunit [Raphidocelis subcapitata]|eukprot:GBF95298.1 26S proteasome regulatory subunit [Raphidocelis subcapitata]